MASINEVNLMGFLGADPELRYTADNRPVCNLRVATNESYKDKNGNRQEKVEWHRVTVWGKGAENCSNYLEKGRGVHVKGSLRTRSWTDKDGKKHYATEIVAARVQYLSNSKGSSKKPAEKAEYGTEGEEQHEFEETPF